MLMFISRLAIGCVYGFAVIDYFKNETLHVHCTFDQDVDDPTAMSRVQSIRRSFRQSLQRMNIRRSMRGMQSVNRSYRPHSSPLVRSGSARPSFFNRVASIRRTTGTSTSTASKGSTPQGASAVAANIPPLRRDSIRTLTFTAPTHVGGSSLVHGLFVGTNQGAVLGFTIDIPTQKQRQTRSPIIMPIGMCLCTWNYFIITASVLEKEYNQRKNNAILFVGVIDGLNYLLDINDEGSYKQKGTHYLVMCTEEILRVRISK